VTLGPELNLPTVSVVTTTPYRRMRTQLTRQAEYPNFWRITYVQGSQLGMNPNLRSVTITMTDNYLGGATAIDVSIPDFSGLSGWMNTWGLQLGANTRWNVRAFGWITGGGLGLVDGVTYRTAYRQETITP
jgi:hypothetical protein